jgi:hypothetical protein
MEIPNGGGGETSICDMLSRAIPTSIPTRSTKITVAMHMVDSKVVCHVSCVEDRSPPSNGKA